MPSTDFGRPLFSDPHAFSLIHFLYAMQNDYNNNNEGEVKKKSNKTT